MRAMLMAAALTLAGAAWAEQVTVLKDFASGGFEFTYGTWEGNITTGPEYVSIKPPATDSGGAGAVMLNKAVAPGAKLRLTARIGAGNQTTQINVVLQDQDTVQGKEGFVYYFPVTGLSTQDFVTVEKNIGEPDLINEAIDGVPNFSATEGGLVGWQLQGTHSMGAAMSIEVKKLELVEP